MNAVSESWKKFLDIRPEICSFRVLEYDNVYSRKSHCPAHHELLYVLDGRMTLHLGSNLEYHAVPGDFLLIPADTLHRDEFATLKGLRILIVHFDWEAEDFFQQVNNKSLAALDYDVRCGVQRRLEFIRECWNRGAKGKFAAELELHAILCLFYFALTQDDEQFTLSHSPAPDTGELMRRVKHYLDQNFGSRVTLKDAAAFAHLSTSYLSRLFHREYGISFSAYLTARRLEAARKMLWDTHLQIGEIASRCGFGSSSYFIKVFTEHYGVTPKKHTTLPDKR